MREQKSPILRASLFSVALVLPMACANQPSPEEICTADWIKPRVDSAMADFRANTGEIMQSLSDTGEEIVGSDGALGLLDKMKVLLSLTKLVGNFQGGQTLKDLNALGRTCSDPELAINAFKGVLEEYKEPQSFVDLLENLDEFKALAEDAMSNLQ